MSFRSFLASFAAALVNRNNQEAIDVATEELHGALVKHVDETTSTLVAALVAAELEKRFPAKAPLAAPAAK
jgi:chorismate mutase